MKCTTSRYMQTTFCGNQLSYALYPCLSFLPEEFWNRVMKFRVKFFNVSLHLLLPSCFELVAWSRRVKLFTHANLLKFCDACFVDCLCCFSLDRIFSMSTQTLECFLLDLIPLIWSSPMLKSYFDSIKDRPRRFVLAFPSFGVLSFAHLLEGLVRFNGQQFKGQRESFGDLFRFHRVDFDHVVAYMHLNETNTWMDSLLIAH